MGQKTLTAFAIIIIFFGFTEPANLVTGNWYQQFMPNIGNRQITDITFVDSLTGYAVAPGTSDTSYILKTINGGDSWQIIHRQLFAMTRLKFFNVDTGFACGGYLYRTTDGGLTWIQLNTPSISAYDMQVLSKDTIWLVDPNSLVGGVFLTTNGGASWQQQPAPPSDKIYMYNARIGFISNNSGTPNIYKTTNNGVNWNINLPNENFTDMHFIDSITGWKCTSSSDQAGQIKKTTNGGLNWTIQYLPPESPPLSYSRMYKFSFVNQDTIWGVGGVYAFPNGQDRAVIYKSTNGGASWSYQIPDTTINIFIYSSIQFVDSKKGWAYSQMQGGVHTTSGGDTITSVQRIGNEVANDFELWQNYPNPFNPVTRIRYSLKKSVLVNLKIYDIRGEEIETIINAKQSAGIYQYIFEAGDLSSGVYFYRLLINNQIIDSKKMILLK